MEQKRITKDKHHIYRSFVKMFSFEMSSTLFNLSVTFTSCHCFLPKTLLMNSLPNARSLRKLLNEYMKLIDGSINRYHSNPQILQHFDWGRSRCMCPGSPLCFPPCFWKSYGGGVLRLLLQTNTWPLGLKFLKRRSAHESDRNNEIDTTSTFLWKARTATERRIKTLKKHILE